MTRPHALYMMGTEAFHATYGPDEQRRIDALVQLVAPPHTPESALRLPRDVLATVDVLITGWGAPTLDEAWLDRLPRLTTVFHGAGTISHLMTMDAWQRGIVVTTAAAVNAVPVAEYTLAMIILCLKRVWRLAQEMRTSRGLPDRAAIPGCCDAVVGLVSLGAIGRRVAAHLSRLDVTVIAHDPHVASSEAEALGVSLVSVDDLFRTSDVVSLHAPHLPATDGMITGAHLSLLKPGASFINTARGAVVREDELIEVAAGRDDLQFVLDVTTTMPPEPASPLYTLPNVLLTPHIAGSRGRECRRMGRWIVGEIERAARGAPLRSRLTLDEALHSSHSPASAVR